MENLWYIEVHPDDLKWDPKMERNPPMNKRNDSLPFSSSSSFLHSSVLDALYQKFPNLLANPRNNKNNINNKCPLIVQNIRVVRRSLDARRHKTRSDGKGKGPRFVYVLDIDAIHNTNYFYRQGGADTPRLRHQPGKVELLERQDMDDTELELYLDADCTKMTTAAEIAAGTSGYRNDTSAETSQQQHKQQQQTCKVIIVGAGPAGLFCALELLALNKKNCQATGGCGTLFHPIVLERGQPVERRGKDIGALMAHKRRHPPHNDSANSTIPTAPGNQNASANTSNITRASTTSSNLNGESNFCFGEGGAGTWSDGKLTTRIGRNSATVRRVLSTLVHYGAPSVI